MHDRRSEYARCTRALVEDRERDGTSGIFDAALTNGLAAIVATRWRGQEADARGRMKSASALIDVIEAQSDVQANGSTSFRISIRLRRGRRLVHHSVHANR